MSGRRRGSGGRRGRNAPKAKKQPARQADEEEELAEQQLEKLEEKYVQSHATADDDADEEDSESADDEEESSDPDEDESSDPDEDDEELEASSSDDSAGEDDRTLADRKQNEASSKEHRRFARAMHIDDLSSDEEKPKNTIGEVPLEWYNNLEHVGYDVDGKKIARRYGKTGVDAVIASKDDPNFKWTVTDERNGEQRVLSERELLLIRRMQTGRFVHSAHNPYPDYVPYYTSEKLVMPLTGAPIPKRRFTPSLHEERKIAKLVRDIKAGKITFQKKKKKDTEAYLMWTQEDEVSVLRSRTKQQSHHAPLAGDLQQIAAHRWWLLRHPLHHRPMSHPRLAARVVCVAQHLL